MIGAAGDRNRNNPSGTGTGPGIPDSGRPVERYAMMQYAEQYAHAPLANHYNVVCSTSKPL